MKYSTERYKAIVKQLADKDSGSFINNSELDYVAIVIEEFLNRANGPVFMVTDCLNPLLYGRKDIQSAFEKFLQKQQNHLQIIAQFNKKDSKSLSLGGDNNFLVSLRKYGAISMYHTDKRWKYIPSFMVTTTCTEKYAVWYQIDIKDHLNTATFNAGDMGKKLFDSFLEKIPSGMLKKIMIRVISHEDGNILI